MDGLGIVAVGLPLAPHLVVSHAVKGQIRPQSQGIEGPGVEFVRLPLYVLQGDAADAAHRPGKIPVDHLPGHAHSLKNLRSLVGLDGGNAHL